MRVRLRSLSSRRASARQVFVCVLLLPLLLGAADQPDPRMLRVERWLKAIVHHELGAIDDAVVEIASWSSSDLTIFWLDSAMLVRLMDEPRLNQFQIPVRGRPRPENVRYTPRQLDQLRAYACAAAGIAAGRYCMERDALALIDNDLRKLAQLASEARFKGDPNYVVKRGALLHTDVAMTGRGEALGEAARGPQGPQRIKIDISDGRDTGTVEELIHWDLARALLDAVRPGGDPMVRLWYRATATWMQAQGLHDDNEHLNYGLRLFPGDPDLLFLSGSEHEALAQPAMQAALRGVDLPPGFELTVGSTESELGEAENFFRRALRANPEHVEARLRLGRVLLLRGRHKEAADELWRLPAALDERLLEYFAALFLGAAEEGLRNYDAADAAYARAAEIYPTAQSPHLARSALARRRGERAGALAGLERAFELARAQSDGGAPLDDPWWHYNDLQGRTADALLDQLWEPFRKTVP